jgi:hypothetical protein
LFLGLTPRMFLGLTPRTADAESQGNNLFRGLTSRRKKLVPRSDLQNDPQNAVGLTPRTPVFLLAMATRRDLIRMVEIS